MGEGVPGPVKAVTGTVPMLPVRELDLDVRLPACLREGQGRDVTPMLEGAVKSSSEKERGKMNNKYKKRKRKLLSS